MALNWNEIKDEAVRFSKDWEDNTSEDAEAKSFLDAFYDVFGIPRKKIGTFEHRIKKLDEGGPLPESPTEKQKVCDVRVQFPESLLADLYDPLIMPRALVKAHNDLDKAIDQAYRSQPFSSEANRMEFLFGLYEKYTADLFTVEGKRK